MRLRLGPQRMEQSHVVRSDMRHLKSSGPVSMPLFQLLRTWRVTSLRQWCIQIKETELAPACWPSGGGRSRPIQRYHDFGSIWTEEEGPLQESEEWKIGLPKCCCDSGPTSVWIRDCCAGRYVIQRHLINGSKSWNGCMTMQDTWVRKRLWV